VQKAQNDAGAGVIEALFDSQAVFPGVRRINRELLGQQALCEETANVLDPAWRTPAAANPRTGSERRPAGNLLPMVSRNEVGEASGAKGSIEAPAPGLFRSWRDPRSGRERRAWSENNEQDKEEQGSGGAKGHTWAP